MDRKSLREAMPLAFVELDITPPQSKGALFEHMTGLLVRGERVEDRTAFLDALEHRESLGSTFMGDGLAIPHGQSETVARPSIAYVRLARPMAYESAGEAGDVHHVFMLAVPAGGENDHLAALAFLARGLMDDGIRAALESAAEPIDVVDAFEALASRETSAAAA